MKENNVRGINDHRSSEDQLIVGVHQLNWRQLSRAKTEFKSKHPSKLRELIKRHFEKILSMTPNGKRTRTSVVCDSIIDSNLLVPIVTVTCRIILFHCLQSSFFLIIL